MEIRWDRWPASFGTTSICLCFLAGCQKAFSPIRNETGMSGKPVGNRLEDAGGMLRLAHSQRIQAILRRQSDVRDEAGFAV